jgi:hypothetical protein
MFCLKRSTVPDLQRVKIATSISLITWRSQFSLPRNGDEQAAEEVDQGHDVDYVPILTLQGLLQGTQVRSFLEANNIPTLVYGETVRKTHGIVIDGVGATTILVPRE